MIVNLDYFGDKNRNVAYGRNPNEVVHTFDFYNKATKNIEPFDVTIQMCQEAKSILHSTKSLGNVKDFWVTKYGLTATDAKSLNNWLLSY